MGDAAFGAEAGYLLASEIGSIIGDDSVGISKRHTMFSQRNLTICCPLISESGITSIHLVSSRWLLVENAAGGMIMGEVRLHLVPIA